MTPIKRRLIIVLSVALLVALAPAAVMAVGGAFTDDDDSIFEANIEWLAAAGVTAGCNPPANDRYCPDDDVTRGQMAAFMQRFAQYLDAEDGTPGQADNATTADSATTADNAVRLGGRSAVQFQPATSDFAAGGLAVTANDTYNVLEASVTTTDGSGLVCLVGSAQTADIRIDVTGQIVNLSGGEATLYLNSSDGFVTGTQRTITSDGGFAISWLYELVPGGTETFTLEADEATSDTYSITGASMVVEVISDTRCKGTSMIVFPAEPADSPDRATN